MRLNELKFPKYEAVAGEILAKYGYRDIGNNASFGSVYHKEGEKSVLKLFDKEDTAFVKFVDFARQHQNNPHFPKFSRGVVHIKNTEYDAVRTELLSEGNKDELKMVAYFLDIQKAIFEDDTEIKAFYSFRYLPWLWKKDEDQLMKMFEEWKQKNKSLVMAYCLLFEHFHGMSGLRFDLHYQNMMMRGSTIVIIDPIAV